MRGMDPSSIRPNMREAWVPCQPVAEIRPGETIRPLKPLPSVSPATRGQELACGAKGAIAGIADAPVQPFFGPQRYLRKAP